MAFLRYHAFFHNIRRAYIYTYIIYRATQTRPVPYNEITILDILLPWILFVRQLQVMKKC